MKDLNIVNDVQSGDRANNQGNVQRHLDWGSVNALAAMPRWEKGFHIFWLLGPFILLIERSPADIWLSILALLLLFAQFSNAMGMASGFWVRASFLFLAVCMVSSALSVNAGLCIF